MTTQVLDGTFLMGFFGPSSGELWATGAVVLAMRRAWRCAGAGRARRARRAGTLAHVPLVLRRRETPVAPGNRRALCLMCFMLKISQQ